MKTTQQIALITGGNRGLGFQTALELAPLSGDARRGGGVTSGVGSDQAALFLSPLDHKYPMVATEDIG